MCITMGILGCVFLTPPSHDLGVSIYICRLSEGTSGLHELSFGLLHASIAGGPGTSLIALFMNNFSIMSLR